MQTRTVQMNSLQGVTFYLHRCGHSEPLREATAEEVLDAIQYQTVDGYEGWEDEETGYFIWIPQIRVTSFRS